MKALDMKIVDAMYIFDAYFDGIENPDDYYVEFGRWIGSKVEADKVDAETNEFVDYVLSFYGHGEIYDLGVTRGEVLRAIDVRLSCELYSLMPFEGDSIDREAVRDIILAMREEQAA